MSEPFLSEIRLTAFNFAPKNWALCNGQLMPINQNQALFSLLGTTYGGDGRTNFALPNLQGRVPMHFGNGHTLGERAGEYSHTLSAAELPSHTHLARPAVTADVRSPSGAFLAAPGKLAFGATPSTSMSLAVVSITGGNQPHENTAPYLTLNYVIALTGVFPSQN